MQNSTLTQSNVHTMNKFKSKDNHHENDEPNVDTNNDGNIMYGIADTIAVGIVIIATIVACAYVIYLFS